MSYLLGKVPVSELHRVIDQNGVKDKNSLLMGSLYVHIGPIVKEKNKKLFLCILKDPQQMDSAIMVPYLGEPFWDYKGEISESTERDQQDLIHFRNHWMKVPIKSIINFLKSGSSSDIGIGIRFLEGIKFYIQQPGQECLTRCVRTTRIHEFELALHAHGKALELNPKGPKTWILMGADLHHLKKYDEAIEAYNKALELNPEESHEICNIWRNKGNAFRSLQKFNDAAEAYDKALEINPNDSELWESKGSALNRLERYDEAIEAYDKALEINPNSAWSWQRKGSALRHLEKYSEAIEAYDRAFEINPHSEWIWRSKGYTLRHFGRVKEAEDCFNHAETLRLMRRM